MSAVAADHKRLLAPGWWDRLGWAHLQRMPAYQDGLLERLAGANNDGAMQRLAARRGRLLERWQDGVDGPDPRLLVALGLAADVREAAGCLEEALLVLVPTAAKRAGRSPGGHAEGRFGSLLAGIEQAVAASEKADRSMLADLRELRMVLDRATPGDRRTQLCEAIDHALRHHPELSMGADLQVQSEALADLRAAARAWLRA